MEKVKTYRRSDYVAKVNNESVGRLLDLANDLHLEVDCYYGGLNDNYIVYGTERISMGRVKPRNYIIVKEIYINCWSSGLEMIMTNNEKTVEYYRELWESEKDEYED